MHLKSRLHSILAPTLKRNPTVWNAVLKTDLMLQRAGNAAAVRFPILVKPQPRQLSVAITASCNLSCTGCRYGRDFMVGSQLALPMVLDLIDDAKEGGFQEVRLYGGEPLLHKDLPAMVERVVDRGMRPYITTNAVILDRRIDALYSAGLRTMNVGFYGVGQKYDDYVHRRKVFDRMEAGIAAVRDRYGMSVNMRINWLLMRPTCNLEDLDAACSFAQKYRLRIQIDLVHYSLPYFSEGPDRELQFRPADRTKIDSIVSDVLRRQREQPDLFIHTPTVIASIPDWLTKGPDMRVPCDASKLVWVGADGTVQLCYVTFVLGNLHEKRLKDMLYGPKHCAAARDAFLLNCPNCHCGFTTRTEIHSSVAKKYAKLSRVL